MRSMVEGFFRLTVHQARQLRRHMSPTEVRLWRVLRLRPEGLKFRKQHPVGPFVLDFYCKAAGLAVEVDGVAHDFDSTGNRDRQRDAWLRARGVETLRIAAEEVRTNLEDVMVHILNTCLARTPPLHCVRSPSPSNDGEDVI